MLNTWMVLVPPLLTVVLAATTRRVVLSLLAGIFSALLILHNFSVIDAVPAMIAKIWTTTELGRVTSWQTLLSTWYLLICLFLLILGIIITMISSSGGAYAYANYVMRYLKKARHAETASLVLSLFFFIDDYFSCLTVGSVMRTVTDKFKIPRVKLALLVNTMAAPLVVLIPVSSWVAEIIMQLKLSGISSTSQPSTIIASDPFYVYTRMIPFFFYSLIAIASLWFLVVKRISFGIVKKHEEEALKTGSLFAGKIPVAKRVKELSEDQIKQSSIVDFLFPIGLLVLSVFIGILYFGNYYLFGGNNSLVEALQHANTAAALFIGALTTATIGLIFLLFRRKLMLSQVPSIWINGIRLMRSSIVILILIWTLSSLLKVDLGTGDYLARLLLGHINVSLLPVMFFLVAVLISSTMGSAWGSLGILIPIGVPMLVNLMSYPTPVNIQMLSILFPLLGAIVSGAVVGNHLSPISDTMLMSSTSTGAYHIDVVRAQFDFTFPTVISSAIAFLISGILAQYCGIFVNVLISLSLGLIINLSVFYLFGNNKNKAT